MVKINRKEYEILKGLDNEWKWVARDKNGSLFAYLEKPLKDPYSRDWGLTGDEWFLIKEILFHFIQWEDEEPHNIQELIQEYEKYKKASDYFKVNIKNVNQSMLDDLLTESEETESKKDKTWAMNQVNNLDGVRVKGSFADFTTIPKDKAIRIISDMDEPETLSEEWLDENKCSWMNLKTNGYSIPVEKLQNLLVQNKEEVDQAYKYGYEKGIELMEVMNMVYEDGEFVERMKPIISVKDKQGNVYTMPSETSTCILEITYSTSYYQFEVQDTVEHDDGTITWSQKTIIVPINTDNWVDFLAVDENEIGEIVEELEE